MIFRFSPKLEQITKGWKHDPLSNEIEYLVFARFQQVQSIELKEAGKMRHIRGLLLITKEAREVNLPYKFHPFILEASEILF